MGGDPATASAEFAEARAALGRALRAKAEFAKAHAALGKLHARAGEMEKAVEELRSAVRLDPADRLALNQ